MIIGGQSTGNGGYSIPTSLGYDYNPTFDSGWLASSPELLELANAASGSALTSPATLSAAIGLGATSFDSFAGDPVNLVNGNLYYNATDISIRGRGRFVHRHSRVQYNSRGG